MTAEKLFLLIPLVVLLFAGVFFVLRYFKRQRLQSSAREDRRDQIAREKSVLEKEINFYEKKKNELTRRSLQRHQLVVAARALGSCLDPTVLQTKLISAAQTIFPGKRVEISLGKNSDRMNPHLKTAPIRANGEVAALLRVLGNSESPFSQEEVRLLDILGSLASMALENSALFKRIQESALRDNLTGLWTHRAFQEQLEAALLEASRFGQSLSLILSDVDHFKSVNDTYGHQAGDAILQGFSHVLVRHAREVDVVARYGGEEFVILLLQTSHGEARQLAESVRSDLELQRFEGGHGPIGITGSFGVATFPQDATSAQQLIRVADERLYAAKKAGRNQVKGRAA